jgi:predicted metalloendopeptidase
VSKTKIFKAQLLYLIEGREYDKQGNLHQWWKNDTIKKFEEKKQCFVEQYSQYQIGNDHVSQTY